MKLPMLDADGHVVVRSSIGNLILDTGSPVSFTAQPTGTFVDELEARIEGIIAPFRLEELSRLIGLQIDALIGMDILGGTVLGIDWRGQPGVTLAPGRDANGYAGVVVPISEVFSVPTVNFSFLDTDEDATAILDSGAAVSLAPRGWLQEQGEPTGTFRREWFPGERGLEEFESPLYRVRIRLGELEQEHMFAETPEALAAGLLALTGSPYLLGIDAFRQGVAAVTLDAARGRLELLPGGTEAVADEEFNARRVFVATSGVE